MLNNFDMFIELRTVKMVSKGDIFTQFCYKIIQVIECAPDGFQ